MNHLNNPLVSWTNVTQIKQAKIGKTRYESKALANTTAAYWQRVSRALL